MKPRIEVENESRPNVIALTRLSTEEQAAEDKGGQDRQIAAINAGVENHKLHVTRWVHAVDVSGRHVEDDPEFKKIFQDLKSGAADGVIVAEQSRLVRPENFKAYGILDHFKENHRMLWTPQSRIDPNTREGWYVLTVGGMISGDELKTLKDRLDGGKEKFRKAGRHPGGDQILPRGVEYVRTYAADGTRLSEGWRHDDTGDHERIRRAYRLLIDEGLSAAQIAARIGGGFTGWGVRNSLRNPIWKGYRWHTHEAKGEEYQPVREDGTLGKPRRKLTRRANPLLVKIDLESIVSDADWDLAQEILEKRTLSWRKSKKPPRFLVSAVLRCACQRPMYVKCGSRGHGTDRYYCASQFHGGPGCGRIKVYREDVDKAVEELVTKQLLSTSFLMSAIAELQKTMVAPPDPARAKRQKRLSQIAKERENLKDMRQYSEIDRPEYLRRLAPLDQEERSLQNEAPPPVPKLPVLGIVKGIIHAFAEFVFLPFERRRELILRGVKEIIVDGAAITTLTLKGGFLGASLGATVNSELRPTAPFNFDRIPDLCLKLPEPIQITRVQ